MSFLHSLRVPVSCALLLSLALPLSVAAQTPASRPDPARPVAADTAPASAQSGTGAPLRLDVRSSSPRAAAPSARFGLRGAGPFAVSSLPVLDAAAFLADDARLPPGALRTGTVLPVGLDLPAHGPGWRALDDGARLLWVELTSPGAAGLRLAIEHLTLAPGAELWVHDGAGGAAALGPHAPAAPFWTGVVDGERAQLELYEPAHAAGGSRLVLGATLIMVRNPHVGGPGGPTEGGCHNDVLCHPEWHPLHDATVHINSIDGSTGLACSATLLATTDGDLSPYVLTAQHCVNSEAVADSLAARFFRQSASCGGALAVEQTAAWGDLLATSGPYDMSLILLHGTLPAGAVWAGWTLQGMNDGVAVAGIHHPGGQPKKISFGTKGATGVGNPANIYGVTWQSGTIQGGSSGSGLYRANNQMLVGVASVSAVPQGCVNPAGPSGYGKLKEWHAGDGAVAALLAAGSDDAFEPNDECASAVPLPVGVTGGLVVKLTHPDWYGVTLGPGGSVSVIAHSVVAHGDVDLELRDGCSGALLNAALGSDDVESVSFVNSAGFERQVLLSVFLADDVRAHYSLDVTVNAGDPGFLWLGPGVAGSAGTPSLGGQGDLSPGGSGYTLTLSGGLPFAPAHLFASLTGGALPFKGGTFHPLPIDAAVVVPVDGAGALAIAHSIDAGVPSGTGLTLQAWFADAGAVAGAAASNGLRLVVP